VNIKPFLLSFALGVSFLSAEEWRTFTSKNGKKFEGRILESSSGSVKLQRKLDQKIFTLTPDKLSQADQKFIAAWKPKPKPKAAASLDIPESVDSSLPRSLYPRSRKAIKKKIAEIYSRPGPKWAQPKEIEAWRSINTYRYLSGLDDKVKMNRDGKEKVAVGLQALIDLGNEQVTKRVHLLLKGMHYHNGNAPRLIVGAINSSTSALEANRPGRRNLLDPNLSEIGIADVSPVSGILPIKTSGADVPDFWSYPSNGFYPKERVHGNGWSVYFGEYLDKDNPPEIEIYRLKELPKKKLNRKKIDGEKMTIKSTDVYLNSVIFQPIDPTSFQPLSQPGIYAVFVSGGGTRASYVTVIY